MLSHVRRLINMCEIIGIFVRAFQGSFIIAFFSKPIFFTMSLVDATVNIRIIANGKWAICGWGEVSGFGILGLSWKLKSRWPTEARSNIVWIWNIRIKKS